MTNYEVRNTANGDTHYIEDSTLIGAVVRTEGLVETSGLTLLPRSGEYYGTANVRYMDAEGNEYSMEIIPADR